MSLNSKSDNINAVLTEAVTAQGFLRAVSSITQEPVKADTPLEEIRFEYSEDFFKMTPAEEKEYIEHAILYALMLADVRGGQRLS